MLFVHVSNIHTRQVGMYQHQQRMCLCCTKADVALIFNMMLQGEVGYYGTRERAFVRVALPG